MGSCFHTLVAVVAVVASIYREVVPETGGALTITPFPTPDIWADDIEWMFENKEHALDPDHNHEQKRRQCDARDTMNPTAMGIQK